MKLEESSFKRERNCKMGCSDTLGEDHRLLQTERADRMIGDVLHHVVLPDKALTAARPHMNSLIIML